MERLVPLGVASICLAPPGGPLERFFAGRGLPFEGYDLGAGGARRPGWEREAVKGLWRRIEALGVDLVHGNSLSVARIVGRLSSLSSVPTVSHVRDIRRLNRSWRDQIVGNQALIAVSGAVRDSLVQGGVPEGQVVLIPDGVDRDRFRPRPRSGVLRSRLGISEDALLIGCIGQISVRKGQRVLMRALRRLFPRIPHGFAVFLGERFSSHPANREYEARLREMAREPELRGRVFFEGFREDIERVLNDLDILAHPAHQEPLSCVLLEAAASGIPIVATDVGGSGEIVVSGESGFLVPRGDEEGLARRLEELAGDVTTRNRVGSLARRRCEERFDLPRTAARVLEIYRAAVAERNGRSGDPGAGAVFGP